MSAESFILTAKDFTILERMLGRCLGRADPMTALLRDKIDRAKVVSLFDVPPDVATLNSRLSYRIDGKTPDTRIIGRDNAVPAVGLFLSIASPRGLALLGLREGQETIIPAAAGTVERVLLEKVLFQPEAAKSGRSQTGEPVAARAHPVLRVIEGSGGRKDLAVIGRHDDPGPSAA